MKHSPYIIDTTLRDGEQAPGVVFHLNEKLRIAELLDKVKIPEVELGTPALGLEEIHDIRAITNAGFKFKTLVWCRATRSDIDAALETGCQGINISFPVSDIHLKAMDKDRKWVIDTMQDILQYTSGKVEYIAVGAQDASKAGFDFLSEFISEAFWLGAFRVRIADTVGILNPISTAQLIRKVKKYFPKGNFEFHGHNDLGMATANTFAAFNAGVDAASVTVNGIGERAGNAALEEIIMALELSGNVRHKLNTSVLGEISKYVSMASGIELPMNKPIVGCKSLSHESGIHTNLILKNRETYQIINASRVGLTEQDFIIGKHSGKSGLIAFLHQNNIILPCEKHSVIMEKIKDYSAQLKRNLTRAKYYHSLAGK